MDNRFVVKTGTILGYYFSICIQEDICSNYTHHTLYLHELWQVALYLAFINDSGTSISVIHPQCFNPQLYIDIILYLLLGFHFRTVLLLLLQQLTILTCLLILDSLVLIFPYTFSCLKTCSTNMNNPCMKGAKQVCHS